MQLLLNMYDINCVNVTHSFHRLDQSVLLPTTQIALVVLSYLISPKSRKSGEMKSYNSFICQGNAVYDIWKIKLTSPVLKFELLITQMEGTEM